MGRVDSIIHFAALCETAPLAGLSLFFDHHLVLLTLSLLHRLEIHSETETTMKGRPTNIHHRYSRQSWSGHLESSAEDCLPSHQHWPSTTEPSGP
jgi:hypothetical protein